MSEDRANDSPLSPSHYKSKEREGKQHWDRAWELYREAWFVLNITKYVERYRGKDGIKDLVKARHYLDKLIELEIEDAKSAGTVEQPVEANVLRSAGSAGGHEVVVPPVQE